MCFIFFLFDQFRVEANLARAEILKNFVGFLGGLKKPKFPFDIYWPLGNS